MISTTVLVVDLKGKSTHFINIDKISYSAEYIILQEENGKVRAVFFKNNIIGAYYV